MNDKKITLNGIYEVTAMAGAWLKSRERGVRVGDVRVIAGTLMYAYQVYPRLCSKPVICWCAVIVQPGDTYAAIREWKEKL